MSHITHRRPQGGLHKQSLTETGKSFLVLTGECKMMLLRDKNHYMSMSFKAMNFCLTRSSSGNILRASLSAKSCSDADKTLLTLRHEDFTGALLLDQSTLWPSVGRGTKRPNCKNKHCTWKMFWHKPSLYSLSATGGNSSERLWPSR